MKLQLIFPALLIAFCSQAQQIPNGDFENWQDSICTYLKPYNFPNNCSTKGLAPNNWNFSYNLNGGAQAVPIAKINRSEISHSGKYALQLGNVASRHWSLGLTAVNDFELNVDLNNPPTFIELYSRISTDTNIIMSFNMRISSSNGYYSVKNQVSNNYQKFSIPLDSLYLNEGINEISLSISMIPEFYVLENLYTINLPADILFDSFNIVYGKPLSVDDSEFPNAQTSIFPNPFANEIRLKNHKGSISISDINGKIYYSNVSFLNDKINTENWPLGVYMLKTGSKVQKIIKQ